jgi:hypothetical protein
VQRAVPVISFDPLVEGLEGERRRIDGRGLLNASHVPLVVVPVTS